MSDSIGARLREAREGKGMSLRALASSIGVSPSLLSQVETGKTKPSVSTLYSLVSQLDISTDMLLGRETPAQVPAPAAAAVPSVPQQLATSFHFQASDDNPTLEMDNGVKWERLSVIEGTDVEALRVTYQPGASSSIEGRLMRHFGIEHVYLISGELTLRLDFDAHVIRAGDSMVFDSQRPHLFVNSADEPAIGVWYITGRAAAARQGSSPDEGLVPQGAEDEPLNSAVDVLRSFRN
ncbi:helix-turn-helix domain-containing protein [Leucobacter rhizosphaerae]|uniref:Helix-turn-helix domain-containing protein n=1 Tax=Leucobacter rhizosphaerae TaxID=2932245 RepID=A0ABY4FSU5_9MICO|nr:helix-turn-helix domain-containing protein [Leucobacter rhizosphaerae]UOQ59249.1 helix-turn-helix domain-containing protein [Leucobacter rhizosphaerae]